MTRVLMASFGLVGVAFLGYTLLQLRRAHLSLRWPVVPAEVVEVRVNERRGRRTTYEPFVRYRYSQNGATREGSRIVFVPMALTSTRDDAERFLVPFQLGCTISIRVSPTDAKLAVIEPGIQVRWFIAGILFSIGFIVVGVASLR
jgi:hypothetical protein